MTAPSAYHQLGKFIVDFQHAEETINKIIIFLANANDEEAIRILLNEFEYSQRLKTADVMFARFVELQRESDPSAKTDFHNLISELSKLGERRNDLVHSKYMRWIHISGTEGLIRQNSKLRARKGLREQEEEELLPEAFTADLQKLASALQKLETFRLKVLDWLYPDTQA